MQHVGDAAQGGEQQAARCSKRKRDDGKDGDRTSAKTPKGLSPKEKTIANEWQQQYYQGVDIMDLDGVGCGTCLLGSPNVAFKYPFDSNGRLEILSGLKGSGRGSIRMCDENEEFTFMAPLVHVEQVIVLQNGSSSSSDEAYRVLIVPTAATGVAAMKRRFPQIIEFSWPNKAAGNGLKGVYGQAAYGTEETYLSVLKRVLNDQLAPFGTTVVDETDDDVEERIVTSAASIRVSMESTDTGVIGAMHFLQTGMLFSNGEDRVYLSFESVNDIFLVSIKDLAVSSRPENGPGGGSLVALDMHCRVTEPFFERQGVCIGPHGTARLTSTLLSFKGFPIGLLSSIMRYAERHNLTVHKCQQTYYNYAKNQPATGWTPVR